MTYAVALGDADSTQEHQTHTTQILGYWTNNV